jgi:hypothetical protein
VMVVVKVMVVMVYRWNAGRKRTGISSGCTIYVTNV